MARSVAGSNHGSENSLRRLAEREPTEQACAA